MRKKLMMLAMVPLFLACIAGPGHGEEIAVAVMTFECKDKTLADLGVSVANLVTVKLSAIPAIKLVERERLDEVLGELGLSKIGVVREDEAGRIGELTGAKIIVAGRAFVIDRELVIVAKVIAAETSRVRAEIAKGPLTGELKPVIEELAGKVASLVCKEGPLMTAGKAAADNGIETIRDRIGEGELPRVAVDVREEHFGGMTIDPAAEVELTYILKKCGFTVLAGKEAEPDVFITGQAFSEFGTKIGELISSKARVEVQAIDTLSWQTLAAGRQVSTAVDISERIAAKSAVQKAAMDIALQFIPELVGEWRKNRK